MMSKDGISPIFISSLSSTVTIPLCHHFPPPSSPHFRDAESLFISGGQLKPPFWILHIFPWVYYEQWDKILYPIFSRPLKIYPWLWGSRALWPSSLSGLLPTPSPHVWSIFLCKHEVTYCHSRHNGLFTVEKIWLYTQLILPLAGDATIPTG